MVVNFWGQYLEGLELRLGDDYGQGVHEPDHGRLGDHLSHPTTTGPTNQRVRLHHQGGERCPCNAKVLFRTAGCVD